MSDHYLVQCFGSFRRPGKPEKQCRKRYLWTASGASKYAFGRTGSSRCPQCGTSPDFKHPYNRFLSGEISEADAKALMPEYLASSKIKENKE